MLPVTVKLTDLPVKCPLLFANFNEIWFYSTDFLMKVPKIKFNGNPSSERRADTRGRRPDKIKVTDDLKFQCFTVYFSIQ